jgi:hypothetical protein
MKPLKTESKPILKNVVVSWYGKITLKILKEKPIKSIRIKAHLDILIMYPWGTKKFKKQKTFMSKRLLKVRFNFDLSKVHNYHLVKVSQNKISHLAL